MSIVKLISLSLKKQSTMHVITFYFRNLKIRKEYIFPTSESMGDFHGFILFCI